MHILALIIGYTFIYLSSLYLFLVIVSWIAARICEKWEGLNHFRNYLIDKKPWKKSV